MGAQHCDHWRQEKKQETVEQDGGIVFHRKR
jgi:hypothetical protein